MMFTTTPTSPQKEASSCRENWRRQPVVIMASGSPLTALTIGTGLPVSGIQSTIYCTLLLLLFFAPVQPQSTPDPGSTPVGFLSTSPQTAAPVVQALLEGVTTTTTPVQQAPRHNQDIYSFLQPGRSYVEYRPQWANIEGWGLVFSFRTHKTSTFLLHSSFVMDSTEGSSANMWVTLKKGVLHITHMYHEESYTLKLGKGLGHDHWHTVSMSVNLTSGDVRASVDTERAQNVTITSDVLQSMRNDLAGKSLTSITSLGGFSPEKLQAPSDFIGCVRGIRFVQGDLDLAVPIHSRAEVTDGCVNACDERNMCVHDGTCLNYYTYTTCDCFGTGFEGRYCERPGGTVVTLQGSEWISYVISDVSERTHSPINKVALEFKTRSMEGVLFYGYSQSQYNHLALSLHNSSLHVSVVFIDQDNYDELWVALGAHLNDNRWHRVVVSHHAHEVQVELDAQTQKMTGRDDQRHLRMDPAVFIGGLENAHKALGLRSQQKFVGCLRAVYFNHDSVLEKLRFHQAVYHGGTIQYACQDMEHTALQFPHKGAFVKAEHRSSEQLRVQLEFRTLKPDSILLYTETFSGPDKGFIQLLLQSGQVNLVVVPSATHPQVRETASVGENLSDNQWHTLQLDYNRGTGRLEVDGEVSLISVKWGIHIAKSTYVGFGPDTQMKYGYVGCMRNVVLQDRDIDPVEVVHTQLGVGVTLGPCDLHDLCQLNGSNCQNGGQCVSVWRETYCECEHTHYEGRLCQFTTLRRTCAEYFQAGEERSGVWLVDIDSSGPLPPTHVYCDMGVTWEEGREEGVTLAHHNLAEGTLVRDSSLVDHKRVVSYRELTEEMLDALVAESVSCHQWVHVNCSHSPLRLGDLTWLVSSSGREFTGFGSDKAGTCGCGEQHTCVTPDITCNCDAADQGVPHWDGGYIRRKHHLPVSQLVFRQGSGQGQANVTMGPLRCAGTRYQSADTVVTFLTPRAFLQLTGWRGGTLEFDFRSTREDAFLLYQPPPGEDAGPWSQAQLYVMLKGGDSLVVRLSEPYLWRTIRSSRWLSDGHWQHVSVEVALGQVRVRVNADRFIYDVNSDLPGLGYWSTTLYVGGRPNNTGSEVAGIGGCIRGLVYNNKLHPLASMASNVEGVVSGCQPTCLSNPCQHGARCEELWISYVCHCANQYAHSGTNCQININNDVVLFPEASDFLEFHQPGSLNFDHDVVVFSFRTLGQRGLLLYLYDHLNNFLLVELRGSNVLGIQYNNEKKIVNHDLHVTGLTDGKWKQVAIVLGYDGLEIKMDNKQLSVEPATPWKPLTKYEDSPFDDQETVVPLRQMTVNASMVHVYVGGLLDAMSAIQGVTGCIRGLKVGSHVLQLAKAAGESKNKVEAGCASGCASSPCQHHGLCVEDVSLTGHYSCDCIGTGFSGRACDKEVGAFFDGSAVLLQRLQPPPGSITSATGGGQHEGLHLNFATYTSSDISRVLIYVASDSKSSDYLLLYLTPAGVLTAEIFISSIKVTLETDVSFINGWSHHVSVHREEAHVILQVDNLVVRRQLNESVTFEPASYLLLGGVMDGQPRLTNMGNFTGDISNVFFTSDYLTVTSVRPLDTYYGLMAPDGTMDAVSLTIAGALRPATQTLVTHQDKRNAQGPVLLSGLPETSSPEMWTFAPWNVGAARTVNLAETPAIKSARRSDTIVPQALTSTTAHLRATTTEILGPMQRGEMIGVFVCITVLLVVAAVIAVFLARARRRRKELCRQQRAPPHDEEEGLIEMVATAAEEDGLRPGDGEIEEEDVQGRRGHRGVRRLKTPPSAGTGLHDDENEETPMLSSMEETGLSRPPGENSEFMRMIESLPMIDEDEEEGEHSTPNRLAPPPTHKALDKHQGLEASGSTSQLEWDPHVEMKLAQPLMADTVTPHDGSRTYHSHTSSFSSDRSSLWWDTDDNTLDPLSYCEPLANMEPRKPSPQKGKVWTESQVLAMLADDEPANMMWNANEELFVDAPEHPSSHHTTPTSTSTTTSNSHKPELILGIHMSGEHQLGQCGGPSDANNIPSAISQECLKKVTAHLSPTATAVESSFGSDYDLVQDDIPRVSSQIDLSMPLQVAANSGGTSGTNCRNHQLSRSSSPLATTTNDPLGVMSTSPTATGDVSRTVEGGVVSDPLLNSALTPVSPTSHHTEDPEVAVVNPYVEPNIIVRQCGPDSDEDTLGDPEQNKDLALGATTVDPLSVTSVELSAAEPSQKDTDAIKKTPSIQAPQTKKPLVQKSAQLKLPVHNRLKSSSVSSSSSDSDRTSSNDSLTLSPSQLVLPVGTKSVGVPDGMSPGLPQRRNIKLKRGPRKKTTK